MILPTALLLFYADVRLQTGYARAADQWARLRESFGDREKDVTPLVAFEPPGPPRFKTNSFDECRDYIMTATGTHRFDAPKAVGSLNFAHHVSSIGRVAFN